MTCFLEIEDRRARGINPSNCVGEISTFIARLEAVATVVVNNGQCGSWARLHVLQCVGQDHMIDCPRYRFSYRTWMPLYWPEQVGVVSLVQVLEHPLQAEAKAGILCLNRWIRKKLFS
jgi:hypothetical protein